LEKHKNTFQVKDSRHNRSASTQLVLYSQERNSFSGLHIPSSIQLEFGQQILTETDSILLPSDEKKKKKMTKFTKKYLLIFVLLLSTGITAASSAASSASAQPPQYHPA
jgi:hypothetical protein